MRVVSDLSLKFLYLGIGERRPRSLQAARQQRCAPPEAHASASAAVNNRCCSRDLPGRAPASHCTLACCITSASLCARSYTTHALLSHLRPDPCGPHTRTRTGAFVAAFLNNCLWMWVGNRQTNKLRRLYLQAVLRQDIGEQAAAAGRPPTCATTATTLRGLPVVGCFVPCIQL